MNKEFVSYDIALTLKELGFDEPCYKYVYLGDTGINIDHYLEVEPSKAKNYNEDDLCISQPTFSQTFKWFRKKHGLMHIINPYYFTAEIDYLNERIVDEKYDDFIPHDHLVDDEGEEIKHSSYEEAEGACLDKLLEIVKKNAHI